MSEASGEPIRSPKHSARSRASGRDGSPRLQADGDRDKKQKAEGNGEKDRDKEKDPPVPFPDLLSTAQTEITTLLAQHRRLENVLEQLKGHGEAKALSGVQGLNSKLLHRFL